MKTRSYFFVSLLDTTIRKLVFVFVFLTFLSCHVDEEIAPELDMSSITNNDDSNITKEDIKRLNQLILEGKFDNEQELSLNKAIGDGKNGGYLEFDFVRRKLKLKEVRLGELCPNFHERGDREFGGGPLIQASVRLWHSPLDQGLYAIVNFVAQETRNDRSTVRLTGDQRFIFIRYIYGINSFDSELYSIVNYRGGSARPGGIIGGCKDGVIEDIEMYPSLVKKYRIIGDTTGNDISTDDDCQCDTKIYNIELADIVMGF